MAPRAERPERPERAGAEGAPSGAASAAADDERAVAQLCAYDLPEAAVREALGRFGGDADAALDYLLDLQDGDDSLSSGACTATDAVIARLLALIADEGRDPDRIDASLAELQRLAGFGAPWCELGALLRPHNPGGRLLLDLCGLPTPAGLTSAAVSWMLAAGADPNSRDPCLEETALAVAVRAASAGGREHGGEVVSSLLQAAADVNARDAQGETPLVEAVVSRCPGIVRQLLEARADPGLAGENGVSALALAEPFPELAPLFAAASQAASADRAVPEGAWFAPPGWGTSSSSRSSLAAPASPRRMDAALMTEVSDQGHDARAPPRRVDATEGQGERAPTRRADAADASDAMGNVSRAPPHSAGAAEERGPPRRLDAAERGDARASPRRVGAAEGRLPSMAELLARASAAPPAARAVAAPASDIARPLGGGIVDAATTHQAELLSERLARCVDGASPDGILARRDCDGHTLLHLALLAPRGGDLRSLARTVAVLTGAGADPNAANHHGEPPLVLAVREVAGSRGRRGLRALLAALLDHGADMNLADATGATPLQEAADSSDRELVELLLGLGADPFLRGRGGQTAFEALCARWPDLVAGLAGAAPEAALAAPSGRPASKAALLEDMARAAQAHDAVGVRGVLAAWAAEAWPLAELVEHRDGDGNAWLHLCALSPPRCGADGAAALRAASEALLEAGADADAANGAGETPLLLAAATASEAHCGLLRRLLEARARPEGAGRPGLRTPLEEAALRLDERCCRALLGARADPASAAARAPMAVAHLLRGAPPVVGRTGAEAKADAAESDAEGLGRRLSRAAVAHDSHGLRRLIARHGPGLVRNALAEEDADGLTPLRRCLAALPPSGIMGAGARRAEVVRLLAESAADVRSAGRGGEPPLLTAVREASLLDDAAPVVLALLAARASPNAADASGASALLEACRCDDAAVAGALLAARADAALADRAGRSPLGEAPPGGDAAALLRRLGLGEVLRPTRSAPASVGAEGGARSIFEAVQTHDVARLARVIEGAGGDSGQLVDARDGDGHSALHLCFLAPCGAVGLTRALEVAKVLLAARASPNSANALGESPLLLAVREFAGSTDEARLSIARLLMRCGADYDLGDLQDTTPLMEAAAAGDAGLCGLLLDRGADSQRRGGADAGASAWELAARAGPALRAAFEAQMERPGRGSEARRPAAGEAEPGDEARPEAGGLASVDVKLRHIATGIERVIAVAADSLVCDVKKLIVRLARRGSWKRVALLSEDGRVLQDRDRLAGRPLLVMADARSPEARAAAERTARARLTEEEHWRALSGAELQVEADSRGIFGGTDREQLLESLLEVKRWEGLSAKELRAECAKRALAIDANPDREDLLAELKQDFSWENMGEAELREECLGRGIPLSEDAEKHAGAARALRSRLRQALRFQRLPAEQLRRACELRHFPHEGRSREELLAFLKSFRSLPPPAPKAPPPPPEPQRGHGSGASPSDGRRREGGDDEEGPRYPAGLSERVRRICRKYPNFCGAFPLEMNGWRDQDVEMYLYSNGFLRPGRGAQAATKPPLRHHFETLGLAEGAELAEVRKAYRRLALIYHPDKNPEDAETAGERFRCVNEAYDAIAAVLTAGAAG